MYVYGCDFITLCSDNHTDTSVAMRQDMSCPWMGWSTTAVLCSLYIHGV